MKDFWEARDARERLLLLIAGALTIAFVLFQFIWTPAQDFRSRAERGLATASSDLELVRQSTAVAIDQSRPETLNTPLQSVVTDMATVYGLTISRIEPSQNDALTLWFEAVAPTAIYAWLVDLENSHGVKVQKASIRLTQDGLNVSANVNVSRAQ